MYIRLAKNAMRKVPIERHINRHFSHDVLWHQKIEPVSSTLSILFYNAQTSCLGFFRIMRNFFNRAQQWVQFFFSASQLDTSRDLKTSNSTAKGGAYSIYCAIVTVTVFFATSCCRSRGSESETTRLRFQPDNWFEPRKRLVWTRERSTQQTSWLWRVFF